jgi:hypothetical protein
MNLHIKNSILLISLGLFFQNNCMEKKIQKTNTNLPILVRYPNKNTNDARPTHIMNLDISKVTERELRRAEEYHSRNNHPPRLQMHQNNEQLRLDMYNHNDQERIPLLPHRQPQQEEYHRLVRCGETTYDCCPGTYLGACKDRCTYGTCNLCCGSLFLGLAIDGLEQCADSSCAYTTGCSLGMVSVAYLSFGLLSFAPCITDRSYRAFLDGPMSVSCFKFEWCIKRYNGPRRDDNNNNEYN